MNVPFAELRSIRYGKITLRPLRSYSLQVLLVLLIVMMMMMTTMAIKGLAAPVRGATLGGIQYATRTGARSVTCRAAAAKSLWCNAHLAMRGGTYGLTRGVVFRCSPVTKGTPLAMANIVGGLMGYVC